MQTGSSLRRTPASVWQASSKNFHTLWVRLPTERTKVVTMGAPLKFSGFDTLFLYCFSKPEITYRFRIYWAHKRYLIELFLIDFRWDRHGSLPGRFVRSSKGGGFTSDFWTVLERRKKRGWVRVTMEYEGDSLVVVREVIVVGVDVGEVDVGEVDIWEIVAACWIDLPRGLVGEVYWGISFWRIPLHYPFSSLG